MMLPDTPQKHLNYKSHDQLQELQMKFVLKLLPPFPISPNGVNLGADVAYPKCCLHASFQVSGPIRSES